MERLIDDVLIMDDKQVIVQQSLDGFMTSLHKLKVTIHKNEMSSFKELPFVISVEEVVGGVEIFTYEDQPSFEVFLKTNGIKYDSIIEEEFNLEDAYKKFLGVKILLLDSFSAEKYGGTGDTFNWELIQNSQQLPFILAGGLNPDNIELALSRVSCTGVDASSGVESHPGKKDLFKVESFIKKVREVHD